MKKTILGIGSILLILLIMATTVLAVDLEMNLKIRRKINTFLKPYAIVNTEPTVMYLSENEALVDATVTGFLRIRPFKSTLSFIAIKNHLTSIKHWTFFTHSDMFESKFALFNFTGTNQTSSNATSHFFFHK